jgi:hypothetical protein
LGDEGDLAVSIAQQSENIVRSSPELRNGLLQTTL